jgi:uncharacterized membrane protein
MDKMCGFIFSIMAYYCMHFLFSTFRDMTNACVLGVVLYSNVTLNSNNNNNGFSITYPLHIYMAFLKVSNFASIEELKDEITYILFTIAGMYAHK